jgi:hypothetical protein
VLPALFLLFYLLNQFVEQKGKNIFLLFVSMIVFILVWEVKYYLAALFLLIYLSYYLSTYKSFSRLTIIIAAGAFLSILFVLGFLHPALQWNVFPEVIYISNQLTCTKYVHAYACIPFDLDKSWYSVIVNLPKAIVYAFFSPFPWQIHNASSFLAAIENYIFIALFVLMFLQWKIKKIVLSKIEICILIVILLLGGLLIMASPNIGSFSRYRIFYLPVYAYLIFKHSGIIYNTAFLRFKNWIEK